jgi:protein tyrosine/serine phosphatase
MWRRLDANRARRDIGRVLRCEPSWPPAHICCLMTERHLPLERCLHLRDIGGYFTTDERKVRWGCLYRSGEPCALTDADLEAVRRLGIGVIVDLRNEWERAARPDRLPTGVELLERSSPAARNVPDQTIEELIAAGQVPVKDDEYITGVYIDLLNRLIPEVRLILETAVDATHRPMLFHCVAGKDRTGIVAAVLLGVLGAYLTRRSSRTTSSRPRTTAPTAWSASPACCPSTASLRRRCVIWSTPERQRSNEPFGISTRSGGATTATQSPLSECPTTSPTACAARSRHSQRSHGMWVSRSLRADD